MSDTELLWEEPPPAADRGRPAVTPEVAAQLRERPNEWAVVRRGDPEKDATAFKSWAQSVRQGKSALGPGFTARYVETDGEARVYAKFVR